jgi:hypothetical protein
MANTFGRVGALTHSMGVSLEETSAAIATLTINGIKYNEAFTLINNIMLKLIKPTDEMKKLFASNGASNQVRLQSRHLDSSVFFASWKMHLTAMLLRWANCSRISEQSAVPSA